MSDTTWRRVQGTLADGLRNGETLDQLQERARRVMADRTANGSQTAAATEVLTAWNEGASQVYEHSGIVREVAWLTRLDSRVRDAHRKLHGQRRAPGERFVIPSGIHTGYTARGPGQFGVADLDCNCRCVLFAVRPQPQTPRAYTNGYSTAANHLIQEVR